LTDDAKFGERVTDGFEHVFWGEPLYRGRSEFQKIDVYQNAHFGRVLTLDDTLQTTERDEFCYHEMLVHPALSCLADVGKILIIGGGDGGTLRHALMHGPDEAVMCEIDEEVVRVSREFLPMIAGDAFDDPRGKLVIADGAALVAEHTGEFDAIIVDSTDPVGAAVVLFSQAFYTACLDALRPSGIFISQTGSPMYQGEELKNALRNMAAVFPMTETYLGFVPTYPGVLWSYTVGTKGAKLSDTPPATVAERLRDRGVETRFYNADVHASCFALPRFVQDFIATAEPAPLPRG
jgi:spermidine synthase